MILARDEPNSKNTSGKVYKDYKKIDFRTNVCVVGSVRGRNRAKLAKILKNSKKCISLSMNYSWFWLETNPIPKTPREKYKRITKKQILGPMCVLWGLRVVVTEQN